MESAQQCQRGLLQRPGRAWCQAVCGPPGMQALKHRLKDQDAEATGAVRPVSVHCSRDSPTLREASGAGRARHQAPIPQGGRPAPTSYPQAGWPGGGGVRSPSAPPAGGKGVNSGWSGPG